MSDFSNASITQIPNIGYYGNSYIQTKHDKYVKVNEQDIQWQYHNVILEPFNENNKYRNAKFPSGWKYISNPADPFRRSGWYINDKNVKIAEVFMKDAVYQSGIRIIFLQHISSV